MKYKLRQAQNWTDTQTKNKLSKLGFSFIKEKNKSYVQNGEWYANNEVEPTLEIKDLNELMKFVKKYGDIVLSEDKILIYNNYIE